MELPTLSYFNVEVGLTDIDNNHARGCCRWYGLFLHGSKVDHASGMYEANIGIVSEEESK